MHDIVYFHALEEDFPGLLNDPAGWPLADFLRSSIASEFATTTPASHWNGVAFYAMAGKEQYRLELTPYFEESPPTWSVQIVGTNWVAKVLRCRSLRSVGLAVDSALQSDQRISHVRWYELSRGVTEGGEATYLGQV